MSSIARLPLVRLLRRAGVASLLVACVPGTRGHPIEASGTPAVEVRGDGSPADVAGVREALAHYMAGHATGRQAELRQAFHPGAQMVVLREGVVRPVPIAEYIGGFGGAPAADEARRRRQVAWIEISGTAAVARLELDYPAVRHTDYMTLLREDDRWRIVGKIAHSVRRAPTGVAPRGR